MFYLTIITKYNVTVTLGWHDSNTYPVKDRNIDNIDSLKLTRLCVVLIQRQHIEIYIFLFLKVIIQPKIKFTKIFTTTVNVLKFRKHFSFCPYVTRAGIQKMLVKIAIQTGKAQIRLLLLQKQSDLGLIV